MKAIICRQYGPPEVLQLQKVATPSPRNHEVLVKIHATAVNSGDIRIRGLAVEGMMKWLMLLVMGWNGPRKKILGNVFSGEVVATGSAVKQYKTGDEVFGMTGFAMGTYAEYICIAETKNLLLKPKNATHAEAAAIVFGGQTAIHFLLKAGIQERPSPKVLIIGATGAVGTAAIQIATHFKADITTVCSSKGLALVQQLGVEKVILYDKEDFTTCTEKFDIVFDAVGKTNKKQCQPLLLPNGIYKTVGGWEVASENMAQLKLLKDLFEQGAYQAVIDKVYNMQDVVAAHQHVDSGRKKGNVVLLIHQDSTEKK